MTRSHESIRDDNYNCDSRRFRCYIRVAWPVESTGRGRRLGHLSAHFHRWDRKHSDEVLLPRDLCRGRGADAGCAHLRRRTDPAATPALLDLLEREHIEATFFCIGKNVAAFPQLAKTGSPKADTCSPITRTGIPGGPA